MKKRVYDYTQILMAYHSEKMEGCASSFDEVVEKYKKPGDCVVSRHFKLFDYMLETQDEPLSEELILSYHGILASGEYRSSDSTIDRVRESCPANKIQYEMKKLLDSYEGIKFSHVADFLARYEKIKPFKEQCTAVGIMVAHKECLRLGVHPVVLYSGQKTSVYLTALAKYDEEPERFKTALRKMALRYQHEVEAL